MNPSNNLYLYLYSVDHLQAHRPITDEVVKHKTNVRPLTQLVECRTSDNLLIPAIQRARVRDASALDILEPPDGDILRSGQRPQPVEVSECDGPCPAMWAR